MSAPKKPYDFVNSINDGNYIYDPLVDDNVYSPYFMNMQYSYFPDTIFLASELNKIANIPPKWHYDFMFWGTRNKKRFSKWVRPEQLDGLDEIVEYYQVNNEKAREILNILSSEQLGIIRKKLVKGGS